MYLPARIAQLELKTRADVMQVFIAFAGGVAAQYAHRVLRRRRCPASHIFDIEGAEVSKLDRVISRSTGEFTAVMHAAFHFKRLGGAG